MESDGQLNEVRKLLALARTEPEVAMRRGRDVVDSDISKSIQKSVAYRAMCVAARHSGTIQESVDYGKAAVREAEAAGNRTLRSEALGSLSGSMTLAGRGDDALEVLERAIDGAEGQLKGQLTFQRGAILENQGYGEKALDAYRIALPIFKELEDREFEALTLRNRGNLRASLGQIDEAEIDLVEARRINQELGYKTETAGIDYNLGTLAFLEGDIPQALRLFTESETQLRLLNPEYVPKHVTRSEALISAGLYSEAMKLAEDTAASNSLEGDVHHASTALLVAARSALLAGDPGRAERLASMAVEPYRGVVEPWLLQAELVSLLAKYRLAGPTKVLAENAQELAPKLETGHSYSSAVEARMLAGRVFLDIAERERAIEMLEQVASVETGPVEIRLQSWLSKAWIRRSAGNSQGAMRAARAGLDMLDGYQEALGASDLRVGIESWGRDLSRVGLELALEKRNSRTVFGWMERPRARSLAVTSVTREATGITQSANVGLRLIEATLRTSPQDVALQRRRRLLQERIRDEERVISGSRYRSTLVARGELAEELDGRDLVEFAYLDDAVWAVHITGGRFYLHEVASKSQVESELSHLRFQLRRQATRGRGSAKESLMRWDELLFGWWSPLTEGVILVPPPELMAAPWSALPTFADVDLVVAPSAEVWFRAETSVASEGAVLLAAGPDLELADQELFEVANIYEDAVLFESTQSAVDDITEAVSNARLAHIVSHATFQADGPMFSSLRLADGDLSVYDLERLGHVPDLVILSACDSGFTEARPGEELTGLTAALLRMGAKTVVASVGLVPDSEATRRLMVEFHRGLVDGERPARALRLARESLVDVPGGEIAGASFICVGSG